MLADFDDLDQLGRIRIEVDHVAGFLGRLRAAVHHDGDVGLRQRGRVVGAVARHRDQLPFGLDASNQLELGFGIYFGDKIVDAGFSGDRRRGELVVAGDHDGVDARAQCGYVKDSLTTAVERSRRGRLVVSARAADPGGASGTGSG